MSAQTETAHERFKGVARRVGAIVGAMEESPFETLEQRIRRLECRLADLEAAQEPPTEAARRVG